MRMIWQWNWQKSFFSMMSLKRSVLLAFPSPNFWSICMETLVIKKVTFTRVVSVHCPLIFSIGYQELRPRWSWKTGTSCSCSVPCTSTASSQAFPSTWHPRNGPGVLSSAWRENRVCCQQNVQETVCSLCLFLFYYFCCSCMSSLFSWRSQIFLCLSAHITPKQHTCAIKNYDLFLFI